MVIFVLERNTYDIAINHQVHVVLLVPSDVDVARGSPCPLQLADLPHPPNFVCRRRVLRKGQADEPVPEGDGLARLVLPLVGWSVKLLESRDIVFRDSWQRGGTKSVPSSSKVGQRGGG